jgi:predicted ATPase
MLQIHTGGNPLFLGRVTDSLVNRGVLQKVARSWRVVGDLDAVAQSVPDSLEAIIECDIAHLDPNERAILEAASVVGTRFCTLAVAATAAREAALAESTCSRWSAQDRFISVEDVCQTVKGAVGLSCVFRHGLYREVIYQHMGPVRRGELLRRFVLWQQSHDGAHQRP